MERYVVYSLLITNPFRGVGRKILPFVDCLNKKHELCKNVREYEILLLQMKSIQAFLFYMHHIPEYPTHFNNIVLRDIGAQENMKSN